MASHVTFREILKGVNFDAVLKGFNKWASEYVTIESKEWLSMDGKALGSTVTEYDSSYQNFVSFVSVFTHKRGQVIGSALLENKKSSEIPKVKELIKALDLKDVVFTLDALHCQKKTVEAIVESGNDYVIQVKENQPSLLNGIKTVVENNEPLSIYNHDEKSRGRNEQRIVEVFLSPVSDVQEWKGLERVIHVKRQTTRNGHTSSTDSYYITSLNIDDAEQFATGIRGHWSIENRLHWVKDVIQHEDNAGIKKGNGIETLSLLKNVAINICREIGFDSIKAASIYFGCNSSY